MKCFTFCTILYGSCNHMYIIDMLLGVVDDGSFRVSAAAAAVALPW